MQGLRHMSGNLKISGMRYGWAIKVPPSEYKPNGTLFGNFDGNRPARHEMYPVGIYALFPTEAEARAFLRERVGPWRGKRDCRVVRVRVEETIEEVDRFPNPPHLRWSKNGNHYPPRRREKAVS